MKWLNFPWSSMIYCHMSSEIIQSVTYDNYDDFQLVDFIFSQKIISLFWGLFNDEMSSFFFCWLKCPKVEELTRHFKKLECPKSFFIFYFLFLVIPRGFPADTCRVSREKLKNKNRLLCCVMSLIAGITGIGPTLASPHVSP